MSTPLEEFWNKVIEDTEKNPDSLNMGLVLQKKTFSPPKKIFDDLEIVYQFQKKDYKSSGESMPWIFWRKWIPDNYARFLDAGTESRVAITTTILDELSVALGNQIQFKSETKNNLEETLRFHSIPFKNAPQTSPKDEDLYKINKNGDIICSNIPAEFDLVFSNGAEKIGKIEYFLPRRSIYFYTGEYGGRYRNGYKFNLGEIKLQVLGSAFSNETQFKQVQKSLKKIKNR